MNIEKKILIILLLFFLSSEMIFAQLNRSEIIGAYIYNFAKQTEIEKLQNLSSYNIVLISDNDEIIKEFKKIEKERKIANKPIILIINPPNIILKSTCLIFISEDKSKLYPKIFSQTQNEQILLVTENYTEKQKVILNLYDTEDGKLSFEMNRGNIYKRQIKSSDELLLIGGTDIDLAELYIESQEQLNNSGKKLTELQLEIQRLNAQFKKTKENTNIQQKKIQEQLLIIEDYKKVQNILLSEINKQKEEISIHQSRINKQKEILASEKKELLGLKDSFTTSKELLDKQKNELNDGIHRLKVLKDEIRIKTREVKVQEITLGEQYDVIYKQKRVNQLFIVIIILFALFVLLLIIMVSYRKRKNKILNKQKEELAIKKELLKTHLGEIRTFNDKLNDKNEELSSIIEQLKQTQQQLIQSEKMASLGVLTAGIAHEINNPINFVYTGINSLQKDFNDIEVIINKIKDLKPDDENLKEKIQEINTLKKEYYFDEAVEAIPQTIIDVSVGANRTAEIVNGLRKFSRMDENKFILSDIHEFLQTSLMILKNKYKNKIEIERKYNDNIPKIVCNPGKITQVFLNIIYNSIDAINEKENTEGKIIITTSVKNKNVEISIKDNGFGIKDDVRKKMFDPFFTTKDVGKGTGLGLSISYGIIEEHKGTIKVISEEGKGTEFIISLPVK